MRRSKMEGHEKKALPSIRTRDLNESRSSKLMKKKERTRNRPRDRAALRINPTEQIDFPLDPNSKARSEGLLILENVTTEKRDVAFKIKTTAPQRYRVRKSIWNLFFLPQVHQEVFDSVICTLECSRI